MSEDVFVVDDIEWIRDKESLSSWVDETLGSSEE